MSLETAVLSNGMGADPTDYPRHWGGVRHHNSHINGVPIVGGKSCVSSDQIGKWILRLLPYPIGNCYVEPFIGGGNILLNRPRAEFEVVNDINGRLVNFWRQCANPELGEMCDNTPFAESEFERAKTLLDDDDPLTRAWAFAVFEFQRHFLPSYYSKGMWGLRLARNPAYQRCMLDGVPAMDWEAVRKRLAGVQICERPYQEILRYTADRDYVDIYCDPPYYSTETTNSSIYGEHGTLDVDEMTRLLLAQTGRVAISGVGDEWEHLGWRSAEFSKIQQWHGNHRTEKLWMNYPASMSVWDGQMGLDLTP